ncbi:MAG: hypothetical protein WEG56_12825 [Chloroflexota bacterium]
MLDGRHSARTILIEILGLPLAVSVESAKPHDVQSARTFLKEQLDPKHPSLPGLQAIVADRDYTGLAALAASHGLNLDIQVPPAAPMLPPARPGGKPCQGQGGRTRQEDEDYSGRRATQSATGSDKSRRTRISTRGLATCATRIDRRVRRPLPPITLGPSMRRRSAACPVVRPPVADRPA